MPLEALTDPRTGDIIAIAKRGFRWGDAELKALQLIEYMGDDAAAIEATLGDDPNAVIAEPFRVLELEPQLDENEQPLVDDNGNPFPPKVRLVTKSEKKLAEASRPVLKTAASKPRLKIMAAPLEVETVTASKNRATLTRRVFESRS